MRLTTLFTVLICLGSYGDEFRNFTDKNGRSIAAKILKVNAGTNKVTLQKENKKIATVPINAFCDNDQKYILTWTPENSLNDKRNKPEKSAPATKERIESFLDTYVLNKDNISQEWPDFHRYKHTDFKMERITIVNEVDYGFEIKVSLSWPIYSDNDSGGGTFKGWILLNPDGEVKYDSFKDPHPIERLYVEMRQLEDTFTYMVKIRDKSFRDQLNKSIDLLNKYNIPSFELTPNSSISDAKESIEEMAEWLLENGTSFDVSEPYVFLPKEGFNLYEKRIKYYR